MKYLVVDDGGTYTKYGIIDENRRVYTKPKIPTMQDTEEHFTDMLETLYRDNADRVEGSH